jgi:hypothetical protein
MAESIEKQDNSTLTKYLALLSIIEQVQNRLQWSELVYILLNFMVFFPSIYLITFVFKKPGFSNSFQLLSLLFCFVMGMLINTYWTISSIRLQLRLKLRYFQARSLERKFNCSGEFFITDESLYFNPKIGEVQSFDGKETIFYPNKGILRMDGFIGAAKPRVLSLMIPSIFFIIYIILFYSVLYW